MLMSITCSIVLLLVSTSVSSAAPGDDDPVVVIDGIGSVTGSVSRFSKDVGVFRGIPYAKPPIGSLRWAPPTPFGSFGHRNATSFGSVCAQGTIGQPLTGSEDCLFLNIGAPIPSSSSSSSSSSSGNLLPVLVWIHGGSYVWGSSNSYDPDSIVAISNRSVIVVTINYRLSIFGFLGGRTISDHTRDGSSGNFGIQDQRAALLWVQKYISSFGGDPDQVTIFGESAGGNSVFNHLSMPKSFPFFHGAIIESGVYNEGAFLQTEADIRFDQVVNASENCSMSSRSLECLLSLSTAEVFDLQAKLPRKRNQSPQWGPIVDSVELRNTPEHLFIAGKQHKVPIMIGSNRDEMSYWLLKTISSSLNETGFDFELQLARPATFDNMTVLAEIKSVYSNDTHRENEYPYPTDLGNLSKWWWRAMRVGTDFVPGLGACGVKNIASVVSGQGQAVFAYLFAHPTQSPQIPLPGDGPGAVTVGHATEIPYIFGSVESLMPGEEADLARSISTYVVNFAKHGNPNGEQGGRSRQNIQMPTWPAYKHSTDRVQRLDVQSAGGIVSQANLRKVACDFQQEHRVPLS